MLGSQNAGPFTSGLAQFQNAGPFTSGLLQLQHTNPVPPNTQPRALQSGGRVLEMTDYPMAGRDGSLTAPDDDFAEARSSGRPVSGQPPLKKARLDDGKSAFSNDRVLPSDGVDAFERARRFSD
ncbi:hypothetical protein CB0940_09244 [Cercospora beticola]|uniref:Uncharacterized protein n=1 Tax=Cercospora beticola TaxID=122368 RepID=A0A2G5HJ07_CERBT|nr:hypothetical protein CB0940_09244 [Cercospora beticola]PIA92193.1 hypothetical protein CB0940_09244 [Cercospora beticola]